MENPIFESLQSYEKEFMNFQSKLQEIRKSNPNKFIAFIEGQVFTSGTSVEEIKNNLESKGISSSGAVIEFVSKDEIKMIV